MSTSEPKKACTFLTTAKGDKYESCHMFSHDRAIANMEGLHVMFRLRDDGFWEEGGPARPGIELDTLNALVKAAEEEAKTTVKVTSPDGSTETFTDK